MRIDLRFAVLAAFASAAALFVPGCGCTGGGDGAEEEAPKRVEDPVRRRMSDPVYVAKLEAQNAERKEIMKSLSEAKAKLDAARAAGAPEAEVAALEAELEKGKDAFRKNRARSMAIVREEMLRDAEAPGAKRGN